MQGARNISCNQSNLHEGLVEIRGFAIFVQLIANATKVQVAPRNFASIVPLVAEKRKKKYKTKHSTPDFAGKRLAKRGTLDRNKPLPVATGYNARDISVIHAIGSGRHTYAEIAETHGISARTVATIAKHAIERGDLEPLRKMQRRTICVPISSVTDDPRDENTRALAAEIVRAGIPQSTQAEVIDQKITRAISWMADVERVGRLGIAFLGKALDEGNLNPANHTHVRVVGEAVVRVASELMRLNWLMETHRSNRPSTIGEVEGMSDEELFAEAQRAMSETVSKEIGVTTNENPECISGSSK